MELHVKIIENDLCLVYIFEIADMNSDTPITFKFIPSTLSLRAERELHVKIIENDLCLVYIFGIADMKSDTPISFKCTPSTPGKRVTCKNN